jgi:hypothetical protein
MLMMLGCPGSPGFRTSRRARALVLAIGLGLSPSVAPAVTGVCPDGSVFVVQRSADVPCRGAKRVDSHEVPPLRPENLPRSYLWDVHREKVDQNNPYNLVDRAAKVRESGVSLGPDTLSATQGGVASSGPMPEPALPQVASAPPSTPAPPTRAPADLGLTDGELRDLFYLVELSQQRAPATLLRAGPAGPDSLRVSFAHSQAFDERLHRAGNTGGGPVLLFSVQPKAAGRFQPNFTFVQGHTTFSPRRDDPAQLGVISGRIGELQADELLLGYVVLPAGIDVQRPIDLYWDDQQIAATFRP